jgi:hypothetical protein
MASLCNAATSFGLSVRRHPLSNFTTQGRQTARRVHTDCCCTLPYLVVMDSAVVAVEVNLAFGQILCKLSIRRTRVRASSVFTSAHPSSLRSFSIGLQASSLSAALLAFTSHDSRTYNPGFARTSHAIVRPSSTTPSQVGPSPRSIHICASPWELLTDISLQLATSTISSDHPSHSPTLSPWPLPHAHTRSKSSSPTPHLSNGIATFAIPVPTNPCTNASTASSRHAGHALPSHRSVRSKSPLPKVQPCIVCVCVCTPQIHRRRLTSDVECQMCFEESFFGRCTFGALTRCTQMKCKAQIGGTV